LKIDDETKKKIEAKRVPKLQLNIHYFQVKASSAFSSNSAKNNLLLSSNFCKAFFDSPKSLRKREKYV
jgi:hypothetical protein